MTSLHQTSETAPTSQPRWFTPGVRGIGLASFLADVGHEIPTALFASLVTITLGAPASILGLLEGLADGLAELARFVEGPLADTLALPPASSPGVTSRAQRAHYRLTFQERLARSRRAPTACQMAITQIARSRSLCRFSWSPERRTLASLKSSCVLSPSDRLAAPSGVPLPFSPLICSCPNEDGIIERASRVGGGQRQTWRRHTMRG